MLTLKNTVVLVDQLLLQKMISIKRLTNIRIQVQTDFDKKKTAQLCIGDFIIVL